MTRILEWVLGIVGAAACIGAAMIFGQAQPAMWPMPGFVLLELGMLGLIGLGAIALDDSRNARWAGMVIWAVSGALLALALFGAFTLGGAALLATVAFGGAAILADRRQNRRMLNDLGLTFVSAATNAFLLLAFVLMARA